VDLLLACPIKGFFVPIESGSTDTLSIPLNGKGARVV
jgi:hypothetical protein